MTAIPVPSLHTMVVLPDSHPEDFEGFDLFAQEMRDREAEYQQKEREARPPAA